MHRAALSSQGLTPISSLLTCVHHSSTHLLPRRFPLHEPVQWVAQHRSCRFCPHQLQWVLRCSWITGAGISWELEIDQHLAWSFFSSSNQITG
ncbi:unnamed protein product [Victoria cruziana]